VRLPFGLGRRSGSADGAATGGLTAPASGGTPAGTATPASVPTRAWASLPAIQRTTGDMPLVAAPSHFVETLPGSNGLPPIVEPLGHEVSALATPGLVVARTRAVELPAPGGIPAPAPVQRRASRGASAATTAGEAFDGWHESAASPDDAASAAITVPAAPPAPAPTGAPASAPIRTMPTVSRQAIRVPDRPLTSAAAAAQPAPVQRASAGVPNGGAPAIGTTVLPRPSGGMRRVPPPAPAVQVSREVADHQPAAAASPAAMQSPTAPGTGVRRGLGEPLTAPPASAKPVASVMAGPVVSRATTSGPLPIAASSLRPVAQRSAAGGDGPLALGPGHDEATSTPAVALPQPVLRLPHLPVLRSMDDGGSEPLVASPAASPSPMARGPEIRPTTGANPLRPSLGIQRAAADDLDDDAGDAELPSPWWSPATPAPATAPMRPAGAPEALGGPAVATATIQRSTAGGIGAATARTVAPARAGDHGRQAVATGRSAPVAAPVQRAAAQASRPSPLPQPVGAGMRATSSAVAVSEAGGGPSQAATPGGGLGTAPVVQTSQASAHHPSPAPASQGPVPAVQREEASAPVAPMAGSGAPSERDLDELAQALFGRIRGRLRNDLIYDREAKGLTFDNV
jgi:hypothetical protein